MKKGLVVLVVLAVVALIAVIVVTKVLNNSYVVDDGQLSGDVANNIASHEEIVELFKDEKMAYVTFNPKENILDLCVVDDARIYLDKVEKCAYLAEDSGDNLPEKAKKVVYDIPTDITNVNCIIVTDEYLEQFKNDFDLSNHVEGAIVYNRTKYNQFVREVESGITDGSFPEKISACAVMYNENGYYEFDIAVADVTEKFYTVNTNKSVNLDSFDKVVIGLPEKVEVVSGDVSGDISGDVVVEKSEEVSVDSGDVIVEDEKDEYTPSEFYNLVISEEIDLSEVATLVIEDNVLYVSPKLDE